MITIAIDDEPLALKLISSYIKNTESLELAATFSNPVEALDFISTEDVDLIFLDIHMPELLGTELAKSLNKNQKIIFTTAFDKYAIEGFKLQAVDYLLKPFSYEEFLKAVQKALKLFELEQKAVQIDSNKDFLFIKSEYKIRRINYDEILYIEGLKDYIKIYLKHNPRPILSLASLKSLEIKLPSEMFMRVHRSFIINLKQVETVERQHIIFGKEYIPVSDAHKEKFQQFLNENFI